MSKAFTKEDEDSGFSLHHAKAIIPDGPFRLTSTGSKQAARSPDPRVRDALARAETLEPVRDPHRAALGVTVHVLTENDERKRYRLVSPEERILLGEGCSVEGPLGRALLGARVGDVREVTLPRGVEELEVVALEGEAT